MRHEDIPPSIGTKDEIWFRKASVAGYLDVSHASRRVTMLEQSQKTRTRSILRAAARSMLPKRSNLRDFGTSPPRAGREPFLTHWLGSSVLSVFDPCEEHLPGRDRSAV